MDARKVKRAVLGLDTLDDRDWEGVGAAGIPDVNRVRRIASDANLDRAEITAAVGSFNRATAISLLTEQNVDRIVIGNAAVEEGRTQLGDSVYNRPGVTPQ